MGREYRNAPSRTANGRPRLTCPAVEHAGGVATGEIAVASGTRAPAVGTGSWRARLRCLALPLGVVALACALPLPELWRAPGAPMEEGFMLVFPELVAEGMVPNRDFLHLYGPGSLWVLAGVYEVFGTTLASERAVGVLQHLGVVFGVFALVLPWGRWAAAAGAAVTAVVLVPTIGLTALAWTGAVALGLWSLYLLCVPARRRWTTLLAGVLAGVALLYRPDLVVAIVLAVAAAWGPLGRSDRRRLAAGFAAGVAPYLVHLAMAGPGNVVRGLVIEPVFELRPGRSLPFPPSWGHFDGFLQKAGQLIEPDWPLPAPRSPAQLVLWLALLFASVALLVVVGARAARAGRGRRLLVMGLFCVGLLPQAIQRADSTHLAWVSCVPLGFLPAAAADVLCGSRPAWGRRRMTLVTAGLPVVATVVLAPTFIWGIYTDYVGRSVGIGELEQGTMRRGDRVFHYGRPDAVAAVTEMLPDVERISEPGDSLFVGTGDLRKTPYSEAYLYYLLPELEPATHYIEMDPGIANSPESGMADELRAADVVILSSIRDDWDEPNDSRVFGPDEPNQVVEEHFCLVGSYGEGTFGRGLFELYERCGGAARTGG